MIVGSEAACTTGENRKTKNHTIKPVQFFIEDSIVDPFMDRLLLSFLTRRRSENHECRKRVIVRITKSSDNNATMQYVNNQRNALHKSSS
jgi:hypothetical protein